jgi:hypothetical protein
MAGVVTARILIAALRQLVAIRTTKLSFAALK